MARATSSLPVPVSPVIRTLESAGATLDMRESTFCRGGEVPTICSNIDALSISSRSTIFSDWSRSFSVLISRNACSRACCDCLAAVTSITAPTIRFSPLESFVTTCENDVKVFHGTIRHQQPVAEVPLMPGAGCPIKELLDHRSVLGMDALKDHFQRRFD